jgi:hypothetical protein
VAKRNPVSNWAPKISPNKDPKFQNTERFKGDGKVTKDDDTILTSLWMSFRE